MDDRFALKLASNLLSTDDEDMLRYGLRDACQRITSPSDILLSLIQKTLAHTNAHIRAMGLQLARAQFEADTYQKLLIHYSSDPDAEVRVTVLENLDNTTQWEFIAKSFTDESTAVQIAAIKGYARIEKDHNYAFQRISFLLFSNYQYAIIECLRTMATLDVDPVVVQSAFDSKTIGIPKNEIFFSGCFLRALESEYYEVRIAAIQAIKSVIGRVDRVYPIVKILLEIINDEYVEVRISVLELLWVLTKHFRLKKRYDVEACLFNLTDANTDLRTRVYDLFQNVKLEYANLLISVLESLFKALELYPEDKDYIFTVCCCLGKNNRKHRNATMKSLLDIDTRFLTQEKDWNDTNYSAKLIFFYNANASLPNTYDNHIRYLSEWYPSLFPQQTLGTDTLAPSELRELIDLAIKIQAHPIKHLLNAKIYYKYLIMESCSLQLTYNLPEDEMVPIRFLAHILMTLYYAAWQYTGEFDHPKYESLIENLRKNAATVKNHSLIQACEVSSDVNAFVPALLEQIASLQLPSVNQRWLTESPCELVYPEKEIEVEKFGCLSVQGRGEATHCVALLPDGSQECVRVKAHSGHLYANLRLKPPTYSYDATIYFTNKVEQTNIHSGPGIWQKSSEFSHILRSKPVHILIKPFND